MRRFLTVLLLLSLWPATVSAETFDVGETVILKATHHAGVPLHPRVGPTNEFTRVPDGKSASILEKDPDSDRWFRVRVEDGRKGWIHKKYFEKSPAPAPPPVDEQETAIWSSKEDCLAAYENGARMARNDENALRLATWNIRWFPKGCSPGESCSENATDLDWLACTIAWMRPDVLALQEILDNPDDRVQLALVVQKLETLTGANWSVPDLNHCGPSGAQHVGFLWNQDRVSLSAHSDEEQLNGAFVRFGGGACAGNIRPGRYARVQSESSGGVDFHLATVHLDSGRGDNDYQNRRAAIGEISQLEEGGSLLTESDTDVIVIGDFNTMGKGGSPPVTPAEEIEIFQSELWPGYQQIPLSESCTEYFRPWGSPNYKAGVLDHVTAARGMAELRKPARVTGYCAVEGCPAELADPPRAYELLSDHCPIVVEIVDEDQDED